MEMVYLDNNATTKPSPEVAAAVAEAHEALWANPSSVHRFGQQVRQRMELARASVASLIGARPRELVFTSGGTEACALAIRGLIEARRGAGRFTVFTTGAEHAAVRELCDVIRDRDESGRSVVWLGNVEGGLVDVRSLREALQELDGAALVNVQWANNETGVLQPLAEVAAAVAEARQAGKEVWLHTDATQAVGKLPVDVASAGVDLLSFAGHKFHGPKGVGALWIRRGVRLRPQQVGGPQETQRRGGTENVPAVIGLGVAAQQASAFVGDTARVEALRGLRGRLEAEVQRGLASAGLSAAAVNSGGYPRLWNTTNLGFRGLEAEAILLGLSERGVCASAGAACSSGSLEPSPVLLAMGVEEAVAHGSIRLSLSRDTTVAEVDAASSSLVAVVERLAKVMPMGR
ncbi:MAG: cysteine desulfurase family protein [Planctomycetota bacterium]